MKLSRNAPLEHPLLQQFQGAIDSLTAALSPAAARQYRTVARCFLIYLGEQHPAIDSLHQLRRDPHVGTLNKSMFVSLRLAYVVVPEEIVELLANIRTQMDGFSPAVAQMTTALFMEEGYFASHLRRMRALYGAKRRALVDGLAPLAARGWTWPDHPAGMHMLARHARGEYVRKIARTSTLDLALLSRYRAARTRDDGLFLRFGALDAESLHAGIEELVVAATMSGCRFESYLRSQTFHCPARRLRHSPVLDRWIPFPRVLHPYPQQRFAARHPR